jgi:ArsR family transcriptional regulator
VLEMLGAGERCVCDLQDALDAAQSRLSFHLKVLKDVGLVTDRKEGRWSYYALNAERFADARAYLGALATPRAAGGPTLVSLQRATAATRPARRAVGSKGGDACCG